MFEYYASYFSSRMKGFRSKRKTRAPKWLYHRADIGKLTIFTFKTNLTQYPNLTPRPLARCINIKNFRAIWPRFNYPQGTSCFSFEFCFLLPLSPFLDGVYKEAWSKPPSSYFNKALHVSGLYHVTPLPFLQYSSIPLKEIKIQHLSTIFWCFFFVFFCWLAT